jgi:hypothetical protein
LPEGGVGVKFLLPLVAALAVFLAACGGGDGGGDETELSPAGTPASTAAASPAAAETGTTPTAAATVEDRSEVEALLKAASLQAEDLPEGFTLDDETFTTNEESVDENTGPGAPTLEDFNSWGRVLGYDATYSEPEALSSLLEGGTLSLTVTTTVYEDSDGADEAFGFVRDQASDPEFVKAFEDSFASDSGVEVRDASISPLSLAGLGDDRQAYEIRITAHSTDLDEDFEFVAQLFGIRRDRLVGAVTVFTVNAPPPEGQLEDLAGKLDERMKDALE